jgi:hypothetical protein
MITFSSIVPDVAQQFWRCASVSVIETARVLIYAFILIIKQRDNF